MNKEQLIEQVKTSPASIFTKEDVINLLDSANPSVQHSTAAVSPSVTFAGTVTDPVITISESKLEDIIIAGVKDATQQWTDVVDPDSAEFSIGYSREVELDSIDVYYEELAEVVRNYVIKEIKKQ
jgi:hypothetical protein